MNQEVDGILVAAHELKAPLAVLRQLALGLPVMETTGELIRSEMVSVSERAIRQVNDLTKIRRLEDGLFTMEPVSVRAVCDDVTRELNYLFNYNKRDLLIKYSNRARLVIGERLSPESQNQHSRLRASLTYGYLARNEARLD